MKIFKDDTPIYLQLRKQIEESILIGAITAEGAVPSLRQMAKDYGINPLTVSSAISALVDEGILYRKRGIGVFVSPGAREKIIKTRSSAFLEETLEPVLRSAKQLEIPKQQILERLNALYGEKS